MIVTIEFNTEDISLVFRYARRWIHYGLLGHTLVCTLIAATEGMLGK